MRNASTATQAILANAQALLATCYEITLTGGQAYYFTDCQVPLKNLTIYLPLGATAGPFNFQTGLVLKRGTITVTAGTKAGSMKLQMTPQWDSPYAPILINGVPLIEAVDLGFLDDASVRVSKFFYLPPTAGHAIDTSPGAVGFFQGIIQDAQAGRMSANVTVNDALALLGNLQMPRALYGPGCWHQVYDAGCTLSRSTFTSSSAVAAVTDAAHFTSGLTQADGYFGLGVIKFTSGVNAGLTRGVNTSFNAAGALVLSFPFPKPPAPSDTFTIYPGCDLLEATCNTKFSNLAHFSGEPWTPDPSTIVAGDSALPPAQPQGSQAGVIIGSAPSALNRIGSYRT